MRGFDHRLPAEAPREQVIELIEQLNADAEVSGIICQLPVPDHLDGVELTGLIDPGKDVDGLTPVSAGLLALGRDGLRPATPVG
jgi:methylenetetrahydrofolate dehydrogenase (NADP+)/methenyltetrahydrofolate cyclohydrolase